MDSDVVRLYSSSPPPLDEIGEEEDEDEFGDFGGYGGGVSSSFSFSEFDTPTAFSQSYAADTIPPDLHIASLQAGKTSLVEDTGKLAEKHQVSLASNTKPSVCGPDENGQLEISEVLVNGVSPSHLQGALSVLPTAALHSQGTGQHRGSLSIGERGISLSNRHNKLNTNAEEEVERTESSINSTETGQTGENSTETGQTGENSTETGQTGGHSTDDTLAGNQSTQTGSTGDNGTEPGLANTPESCSDPDPPESANISQREVPESGEGERLTEVVISDLQQCNDSAVGPTVEVPVVGSSTELPENPEEISGTEVGPTVEVPVVGSSTELPEHPEEISGTEVGPTVGVIPDPQTDEALREDNGNSAGPAAELDDDFGDFRDVDQSFADFSQTDSTTQEGFAGFVTARSGCSTDEEFGDTDTLKDLKEEEELADKDDDDDEGMLCSELPPSDSFADFSSAPCGGLAGGAGESWASFGLQGESEGQHEPWAAFGLQGESESQHEPWAAFDKEQQSSTATSPPSDSLQSDDVSAVMSCRLQHLFQSIFLSEVTPEVTEVTTLQVLLEPQDHGDNSCLSVQGEPVALWCHLLDIHAAHGLKVQWVGSHSNRILLDSLGMRNILFTESKRPVIVPMFAAGLGMLEPTKDPVKSASSAAARPSPGQDTPTLCTMQVAASSSFCEDGGVVSQINLDFFGPMEESSDTDSDTDVPLPGVDPELYELTTAKLENNNTSSNKTDAFSRLMETIEKTSTLQRKPDRAEEISEEATQVISVLPNLSFMKARVLMFPCTLTPTANHL